MPPLPSPPDRHGHHWRHGGQRARPDAQLPQAVAELLADARGAALQVAYRGGRGRAPRQPVGHVNAAIVIRIRIGRGGHAHRETDVRGGGRRLASRTAPRSRRRCRRRHRLRNGRHGRHHPRRRHGDRGNSSGPR